ncbi:hypothetical protein BJV78DRAFT_1169001 [Lactifluus subvellereus]|nr:hypothetical protein BJV78DRAFT_1169001 [Lactifluus subvellereus]
MLRCSNSHSDERDVESISLIRSLYFNYSATERCAITTMSTTKKQWRSGGWTTFQACCCHGELTPSHLCALLPTDSITCRLGVQRDRISLTPPLAAHAFFRGCDPRNVQGSKRGVPTINGAFPLGGKGTRSGLGRGDRLARGRWGRLMGRHRKIWAQR